MLIVNALRFALSGVNALLEAQTPHLLILGLFLAGGFFRSLQFTSINALGYSDVPERQMSRASTLYNVLQQLSLSLGVAVAAGVLEVALEVSDHGQLTVTEIRVGIPRRRGNFGNGSARAPEAWRPRPDNRSRVMQGCESGKHRRSERGG